MNRIFLIISLVLCCQPAWCWGFFAHKKINYYAVFLLPPEMLVLYKPFIGFLEEHAVDPDKRRYAVTQEAPRHYIDIDHYYDFSSPPDSSLFTVLPKKWIAATDKFSSDTLNAHGIVPWWLQIMFSRLTAAFREKNLSHILKYSAELGHYIADSHVPLHTSSNHNGQFSDQKGIHGFWESRLPELLADADWDFYIGRAAYIQNTTDFIWDRIIESAKASDSVLKFEKSLSARFSADKKYAFELRGAVLLRQYSTGYSLAYNTLLNGMVERRMRQSIYAVACFWYSAWVNAGQPSLASLANINFTPTDQAEFEQLNQKWKEGRVLGREE